ncbi:mediator of RNA polymerase II transcription subunit 11-like [Haliotis rubra]|uniref:mediator of RNA polymerase II transcription subunit 11-like n=1 Tax=Haliotis rubra TaxID=36100 RepID=UPI001EE60963|nr:mediator of RNA polymerase II transcription subunit 11-like [Haliotis rubra]XP_046568913.1 mediator of RNA polymerase II transcription subunit 11-like [Haliotis rubra]
MATGPRDRLMQLEKIEHDIGFCIQNAGLALQELAKDKPVPNSVTSHTTNFLKTLQGIDNGMTLQLNYLTQYSNANAHEGSAYGPQKDLHMAIHRMQHVRKLLEKLDNIRIEQTKKTPRSGARSNANSRSSASGTDIFLARTA